jgi:Na+/H+ antiporter NhaD/arsenite permease-like protein
VEICKSRLFDESKKITGTYSLFIASYFGIPIEAVAVLGSSVLLGWRWIALKISPTDMLKKTPWYILVFAFGMYIIIYGLNNKLLIWPASSAVT